MKFNNIIKNILSKQNCVNYVTEMINTGVVGGSESLNGIAPQDNIDYASGDARLPSVLTKNNKKGKNKKRKNKKTNILFRR